MTRTISQEEMERRVAITNAQLAITTAMQGHDLTPMEWARVFNEAVGRVIGWGLTQEWQELRTEAHTNTRIITEDDLNNALGQ